MDRRTYLRAAGVSGIAAVPGCLDSRAAGDGDYDGSMSTVEFKPERVTVAVGESVVWRNTSKQGHTVTCYEAGIPDGGSYFASGGFESESAARDAWFDGFGGRLDQGDRYEHTFDVAGEYVYVCVPHAAQGMVGTVVVEE
jgi:plastocyanin